MPIQPAVDVCVARVGGAGVRRVVCAGLIIAALTVPGNRSDAGRLDTLAPQPAASRELSVADGVQEHTFTPDQARDWGIALAPGEFLQFHLQVFGIGENDEWPAVAVIAPDGRTLVETNEPTIAPSIAGHAQLVASFISVQPGTYRLRAAARRSPFRGRVWLADRRPAGERERRRIEAHGIWREGTRQFIQGTPESLRDAAGTLERALAVLTEVEDTEGQAITLAAIASAWYQLSDAAKGRDAAARALAIWRGLGRAREEAVALSDLGLLAYLAYDHAAARVHYEEALAKHRAAGDRYAEALTLTRLGWVQYAAAELHQVIDTAGRALALYTEAGDASGESIAYNDLGRAYLDLGEVPQALDAFREALARRPPERDSRGAANVLIRTALVYLGVGEWQQALDALERARALAGRAHDRRTECSALVNLGSAYVTLGDAQEAEPHLERALTQSRSIGFRSAEAYALLWFGIAAELGGDAVKSRDYFQQALDIQTAIGDVRGQATTLRRLAAAQLQLGAPREALAAITKSVELSPQAAGLIYSGDLTLADVHAALNDEVRAEAHYRAALARFREIRARHAEALALTRFARFEAGRRRLEEARTLLERALEIHESLRGLIADTDLRMSYTSSALEPYRLSVDVLMALEQQTPGRGFAEAAFHANERARARGLLEMLAASGVDIREGVDRDLLDRERSLRWRLNAKAGIRTRLLAGGRDTPRRAALEREIAELSREWRETATSIRQTSPAWASLTEPEPLTSADVQQLLDPDTVLLAYAPGDTHDWLFAVTRERVDSVALPSRTIVDAAAREVHTLLTARQPVQGESAARRRARVRRADARLAERARALSRLVLGPIASRLADEWLGKRLAIVANGALEYVPFAVLPILSDGTEAPLIARHEVVTLPSTSTLALLRQEHARRTRPSGSIAVIADPVFSADDPRVLRAPPDRADNATAPALAPAATRALEAFTRDGTRGPLARLPFSRAEARAVASQVARGAVLQATDFDASLSLATGGRLDGYRIVHFATHGLIDTRRPELSGLALSLVDASGRPRDGFLRLNTIYNLRLSADLVVLSACQTALGREVAGEGFVGLTRGFMHAGTPRVIASLWQVNDVATAELMGRFYTNLLRKGLPASTALRLAQIEISRDPRWSAPYYWAAFVLQGDWAP